MEDNEQSFFKHQGNDQKICIVIMAGGLGKRMEE